MKTRVRTPDAERKCAGCGQPEQGGNLQRDDDNELRCRSCAEKRRIEQCPVKHTDLRSITRRAKRCLTTVKLYMDWQTEIDWLVFGEAQIRHNERMNTHELNAYLTAGVTDFEHDSAYALCLSLIGLQWTSCHYHGSTFVAWIEPETSDSRGFRVPRPGYNPMKHKDAYTCEEKRCVSPHVIVPEGLYLPPHDEELVRGKRVEIFVGVALTKEEEVGE